MERHATDATRLGSLDAEIAMLRDRHDAAISGYRFEEAIELGQVIAALEAERQTLPAHAPATEAIGVVPALARLRRRPRR
jgi:hypothetical protein